jgi:hypothetical protein
MSRISSSQPAFVSAQHAEALSKQFGFLLEEGAKVSIDENDGVRLYGKNSNIGVLKGYLAGNPISNAAKTGAASMGLAILGLIAQ